MADISKLINKRAAQKRKLTTFENFINKVDVNNINVLTLFQIEERTNNVKEVLEQFDEIQSEIEYSVEGDELEKQASERAEFEDRYYKIVALAKTFLKAAEDASDGEASVVESALQAGSLSRVGSGTNQGALLSGIRLPALELPKFKGFYEDWLEFRDSFESMIHSQPDVPEIHKFHYLRACLEGDAAQVVKALVFSARNYEVAWDSLCKRYDNKRMLTTNHVRALFDLASLKGESAEALRHMIDAIYKHLRALKTLNEPTEHWDTVMVHLISTKLDANTLKEWQHQYKADKSPSLEDIMTFLKNRADIIETLQGGQQQKRSDLKQIKPRSFAIANSAKCIFCKGEHYAQACPQFLEKGVNERRDMTKRSNACLNCLRRGHFVRQCKGQHCKECGGRHHTLLHIGNNEVAQSVGQAGASTPASAGVALSAGLKVATSVLLSTVQIKVFDSNGRAHKIRALLDAGSQMSFVSSKLCNILGTKKQPVKMVVGGIGVSQTAVQSKCVVKAYSCVSNYMANISCFEINQITDHIPSVDIEISSLNVPENVQLADPEFNKPGEIDMLIGAEWFWDLLCIGQVKLAAGPIMQKTRFGWIVSGPINNLPAGKKIICNIGIEQQLERFWQLEEMAHSRTYSQEESFCESHYTKTTKRDNKGKFIVSLPFRDSQSKLGDSYECAKNRFLKLEKRLQKTPSIQKQYSEFIAEYISMGHMHKVIATGDEKGAYYMPHHCVINENSSSTKLRVVFDASCPTTSGISLNRILAVGPKIQPDLFNHLIRFRTYKYVIVADIEKMYRMCSLNPEETKLQRILWRENSDSELETYELATVTYGTAPASFLAIRSLYQLGFECTDKEISHIIQNHFYVDDLLSGGSTIKEVISNARNLSQILGTAGFNLRKWVSNDQQIIQNLDCARTKETINLGEKENTKTLGLIWSSVEDQFLFSISIAKESKITKRIILSSIAQIFDPLGLLAPCTIIAKVFLQGLWLEKLSWDDSVPISLQEKWVKFREQLSALNSVKVPRHAVGNEWRSVQVHGFSDASQKAYGACVYIRTTSDNGVHVKLLCAKSKVAPLKVVTIPRLELCAALLLARLVSESIKALDIEINNCFLWSDSTIVLGWLKMPSNTLQTFVGNRVSQIQEITGNAVWKHVPTHDNPADLVSRGVEPNELQHSKLWWSGPTWLTEKPSYWPPDVVGKKDDIPELKTILCHKITVHFFESFGARYSCFHKLQRIVAYCLRFGNNCRRKERKINASDSLTVQELNQATFRLVKLAQNECFQREIKTLNSNECLESKNELAKLNPFLDEQGILRVGGRLSNSSLTFDRKHPMLLTSRHYLTKLLFKSEHLRLLHAGPQLLLASIRQQFWPLHGRNLARKTVHECIKCFRCKPKVVEPIMGNLPSQRLQPSPPFFVTATDFAGPFNIKDRKGRGCKVSKVYLCLFVCFSTKAIHMEIVSSLTSEAFLAALRRFISRRGKPNCVYSDNGTNFVGANAELGKFIRQCSPEISKQGEITGIAWHFMPPQSPHFGGLHEAGVKAAKFHIKRVAGNELLTFEELDTLVVQVEAVLNSRPITPLSADPNDLEPLTPGHFLIGRPLTALVEPDLTNVAVNRLSRFQHIQQMTRHFWNRWHKEYVAQLQERTKWKSKVRNLKVGDMVVIKDDHQPPLRWHLGRITATYPGSDGVVRVASIKTKNGEVKRSCAKMCRLPIEQA